MASVSLPSGLDPWQNSSYKGDDVPVCFGTLALAGEMANFRPSLHQRELLDLRTLLDKVAGVHVEATCTVVGPRDTQINKFNQLGGKGHSA